jgi:tetratricopeptide (TPR) repeat protein
MNAEINWQAFFQQKRSQYIDQWVTYVRLYSRDHAELEAELANLLSSAEQASEIGDNHNILALVQLLCTGDEAFLDLRGHMSESVRLLPWAVDAAHALGDKREEGRLLGSLGLCWWALDKPGNAIDCYKQALALAGEAHDRQTEGRHLGSLGVVWATLMDSRLAISYYKEALAIAREVGDRQAEESHLGALGLVWAEEGMGKPAEAQFANGTAAPYFQKAIQYYQQALAIAREIGDRRGEGSQLGNLGNAWRYLGEVSRAIKYLEQALIQIRESGDRRNEGFHLANLGNAYQALGKLQEAYRRWQESLAVFDAYGDSRAATVRTWLQAVKAPTRKRTNKSSKKVKNDGQEKTSHL